MRALGRGEQSHWEVNWQLFSFCDQGSGAGKEGGRSLCGTGTGPQEITQAPVP